MHKLSSAYKSPWTGIRRVAYRLFAIGAALTLIGCRDDNSVFTYGAYRVTGSVSGVSAPGLVLRNSGGDELTVAANAASFEFATRVAAGGSYNVTVVTQPQGMNCAVVNGSGSNVRATVRNINVACNPITYTVAGTMTGLTADGLILQNDAADNLSVAANAASFQFATPVAAGGSYNVTVYAQPSGLTCSVNTGSGSNVQAAVTTIGIACSPVTHAIAGAITGLTANGLVIRNNAGDNLTVAANATSFQFASPIAAGGSYSVTALSQPVGMTCSVSNGTGSNVQAVVTTISIACSPITHTVAGVIAGLTASGLVIQNNAADNLTVAANATSFQFVRRVAAGGSYEVTALSQPSGLTCTVSNGTGDNLLANINTVQIACSANAFSIGGTIAGLAGSGLILQDNGGDDLTVAANATAFAFATPVASGGVYDVTVSAQPAGQTCVVTQGSAVATTTVANVAVTCTNIVTYTIAPSAGANGSISPSSAVVVNSGDAGNFVATPDSGYAIDQWLLDGSAVQSGGDIFTLANIGANHALEVTFAQATLTPSVTDLALAMNCLPASSCPAAPNAALTGTPRQIVITNTGAIAATNVSITYPTWPAGTTASSTCGSVLTAASSCTITITPGAAATSDCTSGIAPTSGVITMSADDAADSHVPAAVLGYGCIYQGGYIFSIDDTTATTGSVGGKVAALYDQSTGIAWSSDGSGSVSYDAVLGIDETSTASSPSPTSPPYPSGTQIYAACQGNSDGACNTANILSYYNFNRTSGGPAPTPWDQYAAGTCKATIAGYSDWHQPAICELGYDNFSNGSGCGTPSSPTLQNMQSNLFENGNVGNLFGSHWSSTEFSGVPNFSAWMHYFDSGLGGGSDQSPYQKGNTSSTRCARSLTP